MTLEEFQSLCFGDRIIQRDKSGDAIGIVIETNKEVVPIFVLTEIKVACIFVLTEIKVAWTLGKGKFETRYKQNESFLWRHFEIYKRAGE